MNINKKSKRYIQKAFLKLMEDRNFEELSVKDITDAAELSRGTFYLYYDSKYDLAEDIENSLFSGFIVIMEKIRREGRQAYYGSIESGSINPHFVEYFQYIREHFYEFKILFSPHYISGFTSRFSRVIVKNRFTTLKCWSSVSVETVQQLPVHRIYREEILSSLYISLFSTWVSRNMDLPEEEMARMLGELWRPLSTFG